MTDTITVTSGGKAREFVQKLQPFKNNSKSGSGPKGASLWGEWLTFTDADPIYVVYSYGRHWPLFANWKGVWFANEDKASRTTSKHYSQAHPHTVVVDLPQIDMEYLVLFLCRPEKEQTL
jgi:hypothetical protein